MAALNRPTTATYEVHETMQVDTKGEIMLLLEAPGSLFRYCDRISDESREVAGICRNKELQEIYGRKKWVRISFPNANQCIKENYSSRLPSTGLFASRSFADNFYSSSSFSDKEDHTFWYVRILYSKKKKTSRFDVVKRFQLCLLLIFFFFFFK